MLDYSKTYWWYVNPDKKATPAQKLDHGRAYFKEVHGYEAEEVIVWPEAFEELESTEGIRVESGEGIVGTNGFYFLTKGD